MSRARVVSVIIAVALAGTGVLWFQNSGAPNGDPNIAVNPLPSADVGSRPIDLEPDLSSAPAPGRPDAPGGTLTEDPLEELEQWKGTAVAAGDKVPVGVTYRPGTVTQYRVTYTSMASPKGETTVAGQRQLEGVTVTVLAATKDGGARIQVKRDWIKLQTLAGADFTFEYDSRTPDPRALESRAVALAIEPLVAMLPAAYEFRLDVNGNVLSVAGVDVARKLYQEALLRLNEPNAAEYGPTEEEEKERIRAWLFPSLGGGEITNGEPRKYVFRVNTGYRYWATFTGKLDATHNDPDTFCVSLDDCTAGFAGFGKAGTLPNGQKIGGLQVAPERDRLKGAWVFDRTAGRLQSARVHPKFQLVVSFPTTDQSGRSGFDPHHRIVEQLLTADVLDEDAGSKPDKDSGDGKQDTGGSGNAGGDETGNGERALPDENDAPK